MKENNAMNLVKEKVSKNLELKDIGEISNNKKIYVLFVILEKYAQINILLMIRRYV